MAKATMAQHGEITTAVSLVHSTKNKTTTHVEALSILPGYIYIYIRDPILGFAQVIVE